MREIASFAAYAVFIAAGAVALWSIARDLRRAWRASRSCDDCWLMERPRGGL